MYAVMLAVFTTSLDGTNTRSSTKIVSVFSKPRLVLIPGDSPSKLQPVPYQDLMTRYPCATAWTISARLTMPTSLPSRKTGTRLMVRSAKSIAISLTAVSSPTAMTAQLIISLAITGRTPCNYIDLRIEQGAQLHQGLSFELT